MSKPISKVDDVIYIVNELGNLKGKPIKFI
jgi:hypothetical protein